MRERRLTVPDEVTKTELDDIPSDRGQRVCPHEGERIPLLIKVGGQIKVGRKGASAKAHLHAKAPSEGKFGSTVGVTLRIACAAGTGVAVALILAVASAPGWLIGIGGVVTIAVMAGVLLLLRDSTAGH